MSGDVDGGPRQDKGNARIDADCSEESSHVGHAGSLVGVLIGKENDVADDSYGGGDHNEEGATLVFLGKYSPEDSEDCCYCIRWDSEELRLSSGIAHVFDDCRLETMSELTLRGRDS